MRKERAHRSQVHHPGRDGKSVPNPTSCKEGRGVRNFACEHYDVCLNRAAKAMWSGFTCRSCGQYRPADEEVCS